MALNEGLVVKFSLGFLLVVFTGIIAATSTFVVMRRDVLTALTAVEKQGIVIQSVQESLRYLQMDSTITRESLKSLSDRYERDMNRYIRDYPTKGQ